MQDNTSEMGGKKFGPGVDEGAIMGLITRVLNPVSRNYYLNRCPVSERRMARLVHMEDGLDAAYHYFDLIFDIPPDARPDYLYHLAAERLPVDLYWPLVPLIINEAAGWDKNGNAQWRNWPADKRKDITQSLIYSYHHVLGDREREWADFYIGWDLLGSRPRCFSSFLQHILRYTVKRLNNGAMFADADLCYALASPYPEALSIEAGFLGNDLTKLDPTLNANTYARIQDRDGAPTITFYPEPLVAAAGKLDVDPDMLATVEMVRLIAQYMLRASAWGEKLPDQEVTLLALLAARYAFRQEQTLRRIVDMLGKDCPGFENSKLLPLDLIRTVNWRPQSPLRNQIEWKL